jgi:membrane fusion protein (multidrug efflux system)
MTQTDQPRPVAVAWIGRYRRTLLVAGPVLVALVILGFYLAGGRYISTDDAYVQSARVDISANISERLKAIYVRDNEPVMAGTVLFVLDSSRFESRSGGGTGHAGIPAKGL